MFYFFTFTMNSSQESLKHSKAFFCHKTLTNVTLGVKSHTVSLEASWMLQILNLSSLVRLASFVLFLCYFFSPSLLTTSSLGNIQWRWLQLTLFLAATHFLECLMTNTSSLTTSFLFSLSFQFTSFESSLLFTPYELKIESNFERARSRVSGRSQAGVPVSFPIRSI